MGLSTLDMVPGVCACALVGAPKPIPPASARPARPFVILSLIPSSKELIASPIFHYKFHSLLPQ
jgi:hypothetical protein